MIEDELFMARAFELARRPLSTRGNPRVGAVVVRDAAVISEGWHPGAGSPHAELQALTGLDAAGATLYVNLEPCMHEGRTPPCVPIVIEAGIARVVVATLDPDRRVSGRGVDALRAAGVEVSLGVLADEAEALNAPYLHHRRTGRSFLTLKLALSQDGRMGAPDNSSRWITGDEARREVHRRRAEAGAVMVGSGTVIADDPSLTSREVEAEAQPLKVILDGSGRVGTRARIFDEGESLIATTSRSSHETQVAWKERGAEVVVLDGPDGAVDITALLELLGRRGITEVYAEGGARLATFLLATDLVDRLEIYRAPLWLGSGGPEIGAIGISSMSEARRWSRSAFGVLGDDTFEVLVRKAG